MEQELVKNSPIQEPVKNVQTSLLQELPNVPIRLISTQCIFFSHQQDELLICGGFLRNHCFSYNFKNKQYRSVCSYPSNIGLYEHTVVVSSFSSSSSSSSSSTVINTEEKNSPNTITLLSFGGNKEREIEYHTLMMNYQSVWMHDDTINENGTKENQEQEIEKTLTEPNQWTYLPNDIKFGEKQEHDLQGARAVIAGSQQHLLFITHAPHNIDVIDLRSFQYLEDIKDKTLPVSEFNQVDLHCFVSINDKKDNEFILISRGETFLIQFCEVYQEFHYQRLSIVASFADFYAYAFACWKSYIFLFGGFHRKQDKKMSCIWIFDIKEKNWKECGFSMPFALRDAAAVVNENESSIHIIGGENGESEYLSTHYTITILTLQEIELIVERWVRENKLKLGWICEFHDIIADYINAIV